MEHDVHARHDLHRAPRGYNWIIVAFLAIAAFFLFTEHRAHLLGVLPFLLLLACPLMHLFMHHGHGNHDRHPHNHGSSEGGESK